MAARWLLWAVMAFVAFLWGSTVMGVAAVMASDGVAGWWAVLPLALLPLVAVAVIGRRRAGSFSERGDAFEASRDTKPVATSSSGEAIPELTAREAEVLGLLAEGLTNRQIAQRLYVSAATVKSHVNAICRKLQAENRTHAVAIARRRHLLEA